MVDHELLMEIEYLSVHDKEIPQALERVEEYLISHEIIPAFMQVAGYDQHVGAFPGVPSDDGWLRLPIFMVWGWKYAIADAPEDAPDLD